MCEKPTYEELETLYHKTRLELSDAEYEREMYREKNRELRCENKSQKHTIEFNKRENEKTFNHLLGVIFPNFWRKSWMSKGMFPSHVIKDYEDGMIGLVIGGYGTNKIKCYMQNETEREISTDKKDWVTIY